MKYHALVVDDNPAILQDLKDRLDSLGHSCDCVDSQNLARKYVVKNGYSYVLLDLEIPVQYGRPSRIQNGKNLILDIRSIKGHENLPIIIMTSHYQGRPELAINVLRHNGATDFIEKPFPENGKTLEVTIKEALEYSGRSRPGAAVLSKPQNRKPPLKFESGKMIFYKDRVELCDVVVCKGNVLIRLVLEKLCTKRNNGKYCAYSGESLAKLINAEDANNVAGAIRDFRCRVIESLLNEANIICDKKDVILSGGPGYRFSDRIILETGIAESQEKDVQGSNEIASRRRDWIMKRIQQHGSIRMGMLVENFRCSIITAKRDLHELRNSGLIEFIGAGPSGVWRAKC